MLVQSSIFAAYVAYVHDRLLDHPGVEPTLKEIRLTMMPMGGPSARAFILAYKKKCTKCRIRLKETIQKELADFPNCRTTIAPPFYYVQMDIAMAFKSKPYNNSRRATSTCPGACVYDNFGHKHPGDGRPVHPVSCDGIGATCVTLWDARRDPC